MNRVTACLTSLVLTYLLCAISGVNRWMFIWLKRFYPSFAIIFWGMVACMFVIGVNGVRRRFLATLMVGVFGAYAAGIIAYALAPSFADGSWARLISTIHVFGLGRYAAVSLLYPLLLLSWLGGVVAVFLVYSVTMQSRKGLYIGLVTAVSVTGVGWTFFVIHHANPAKW
jgi:hypothetical protein